MKILALEREFPGITVKQFDQVAESEAARVWELFQAGVIREIYFRADQRSAVILLECLSVEDARLILNTLPMVAAGLIEFEIIPLAPYDGFERLFDAHEG